MANKYIREAEGGNKATPALTDSFEIDDGTTSYYINLTDLLKIISSLTADATPDVTADYIPTYDASVSGPKKVLLNVLLTDANLTFTDITTNNSSTSKHGFLKKLSNTASQYMDGTGSWSTPSGGSGGAQMLMASVPTTSGAPIAGLTGASSPAEGLNYFEFVNGSVTYRDFLCRLYGYTGNGLTINFEVMRTSAAAAATYIFDAAIRRINTASEDLGSAHTYDYNTVTVTIPAGPPSATIPMAGTITFTDGADMDSLANNELFILRFRRNGGTATDTARVLPGISIKAT